MTSIIGNAKKYHDLMHELLYDNAMIAEPKQLRGLIKLSQNKKGKVVGWEIEDKEIKFISNDYLDCDERAIIRNGFFEIINFSYHFNPGSSELCSYRIDLRNKGDLHLNTDSGLRASYDSHLEPSRLSINICDFNCLLAIQLALLYIRHEIYPADKKAKKYESTLKGLRRKLR